MIVRLLIALLVAVFVGALIRMALLQWRQRRAAGGGGSLDRSAWLKLGAVFAVVLLVVAVATGRLHWLFALAAGAFALLQRLLALLPALGWLRRQSRRGNGPDLDPGATSVVSSRFLRMELDLASGALRGRILDGPHAGRDLASLDLVTLLELLRDYRETDSDSARLLETWLDREHGSAWRNEPGAGPDAAATPPPAADGDLSREDALAILGLEGTPSVEAIRAAHRRMMQKFHPDHGGSTWLASRINAARDRLLDDR